MVKADNGKTDINNNAVDNWFFLALQVIYNIRQLLSCEIPVSQEDIGVIAPYARQVSFDRRFNFFRHF